MKQQNQIEHLWLELTAKCNLECSHCYTESSPRLSLSNGMNLNDWIKVLEESSEKGCKTLQLIGGEPLLHPEIDKIIGYANSLDFKTIEVFTNATFINNGHLDLFKKFNVKVATSFYSYNPEIHDTITNVKNSFQKTVQGIIKIIDNGIKIRASIIEMSDNKGGIDKTKLFLQTLGITDIQVDRERSVGRGNKTDKKITDNIGDVCGNCWKGRLCVTSNGDVYPCIMSRSVQIGNILENDLNSLINSRELQKFRKDVKDKFTSGIVTVANNCSPDNCGPNNCGPSETACGPDNCGPNETACGPDNCGPNETACGPDNCAPND